MFETKHITKTRSSICFFSPNPKVKEGKTVVCANDPEAAFLGPKLWDKPISLPPLDDTEFSIMNIDDFLNENNISLDADPVMPANPSKENTPEPGSSNAAAAMAMSPNSAMLRTKMEQMDMASSPEETYGQEDDDEAGNNDREEEENEAKPRRGTKRPAGPRNQLPKVRFFYILGQCLEMSRVQIVYVTRDSRIILFHRNLWTSSGDDLLFAKR